MSSGIEWQETIQTFYIRFEVESTATSGFIVPMW